MSIRQTSLTHKVVVRSIHPIPNFVYAITLGIPVVCEVKLNREFLWPTFVCKRQGRPKSAAIMKD